MKSKQEIFDEYTRLVTETFHNRAISTLLSKGAKPENIEAIINEGNVVSAVTVLPIGKRVYAILYTATKKEHRNKGLGRKLMEQVHQNYQGTFLLRTRDAKEFYHKLGYRTFKVSETHTYMAYSNDDAPIY